MEMTKTAFEYTYRGKKVFVTGHTGFKGSWLIAWLHQLGAEVKGYALEPESKDDLFYRINGNALCHSVIADVRDKETLASAIVSFEPDFIFHLAAQPLVRLSYQQPIETFDINVMGTVHLLDALRALQKPCTVVVITTDKVYDNKEWFHPYRESDSLGGYDPYSASKACTELVVSSYRNSFFSTGQLQRHQKAVASARAGNVIGAGDFSKDRIIPDIVKALQKEETVLVRNPSAVRPWQHVLEPLSGYLLLGGLLQSNARQFSGAWNFGPYNDDSLTVEQIVKTVLEIWGKGSYSINSNADQLHEAGLLRLDISKSLNVLQWKPKLDAKKSLALTVEGYRELGAGNNQIIFQQIDHYSNL
jgi:CDP-glucose 4,6-dehydratase